MVLRDYLIEDGSGDFVFFYKIINGLAAPYLYDLLPEDNIVSHNLRNLRKIHLPAVRTERFQSSFFPYTSMKWNELDPTICNLPSLISFKKALLEFIRPTPSPIYNVHHPHGLMLLTRLRVGLSHLREHKFRHNFNDTVDPFCSCRSNAVETTEHYLLHCSNFSLLRKDLIDNLQNNGIPFYPYNGCFLTNLLLYGNGSFDNVSNQNILSSVIHFCIQSKRFDGPLF